MPNDPGTQRSLILYAIWMTALAVVALWAAYLIREVLLLIYVSLLLAAGFSPIIRLIERQRLLPIGTRRFPRWLAILVLYVFIIATLVGIGAVLIPPLVDQAQELWAQKGQMFYRAQMFLIERGVMRTPVSLQEALESAQVSGDTFGRVFGAVRNVLGGVVGFLTILILTFYLLVDSWSIRRGFVRLFPRRHRARVDSAAREITLKVSAWLGGQLLLSAIIGVTTGIGLWLIGVPFFYVLALISAIGELIPVIGPVLAAIPAVAVAGSVSYQKAIIVIVFFIVQQQLENHILVPKVMERQVGVSAVTVIVALLIGGKLLGILGVLLAVPTAAIVQVLLMELLDKGEQPAR